MSPVPAPRRVAQRARCSRCLVDLTWAKTEGKGLSLPLVPDGEGNIVMTGETAQTARGNVPVVRYVQDGHGTHSMHSHGERRRR